MTTVMMEQMSWPEFRDQVAKNPVVFLPCGATEQHGPHLPLSVDALMSAAVAREVAEEVGGIVAPTLHFGYKSMPKSGGGPFPNADQTTDGSNRTRWRRPFPARSPARTWSSARA